MDEIEEKYFFGPQPLLLVSVVNGKEAEEALKGGADIIDLKNPPEGALGAPFPRLIREVENKIYDQTPFSVAIGEFPGKPAAAALAALGSSFFQPDFIKIAFLPEQSLEEIAATLQEINIALTLKNGKRTAQLVAVIYGDTLRAAPWTLADFILTAKKSGAEGCLIDTWEKRGRSLRDYLGETVIAEFITSCQAQGLFSGVAGALQVEDFLPLKKLKPDLIGVRSAVCGGDRLYGSVSASSVNRLKALCSQ